jgi:hypothetical protein
MVKSGLSLLLEGGKGKVVTVFYKIMLSILALVYRICGRRPVNILSMECYMTHPHMCLLASTLWQKMKTCLMRAGTYQMFDHFVLFSVLLNEKVIKLKTHLTYR